MNLKKSRQPYTLVGDLHPEGEPWFSPNPPFYSLLLPVFAPSLFTPNGGVLAEPEMPVPLQPGLPGVAWPPRLKCATFSFPFPANSLAPFPDGGHVLMNAGTG